MACKLVRFVVRRFSDTEVRLTLLLLNVVFFYFVIFQFGDILCYYTTFIIFINSQYCNWNSIDSLHFETTLFHLRLRRLVSFPSLLCVV